MTQNRCAWYCVVLYDNALYHMVHIPWYKAGCDTNRCAWYCVVLYGTMQSIVWYCLISCGVVSERGEGESVTHSQVNEQ